MTEQRRSLKFAGDNHPRFWWHGPDTRDYVPTVYDVLTDEEWELLEEWYAETLAADSIGEWNPPAMSVIHGLINGGGLTRVLQIGHYYGYSALLIGWWLRAMGGSRLLVSIDIDPKATEFTQRWIDRAGLGAYVKLLLADATTEQALEDAVAAFGGSMPQLILRDSTHDYRVTKRELDLWVPRMDTQSIMLINGTSTMSSGWDESGRGGPQKALRDWTKRRKDVGYISLNDRVGAKGTEDPSLAYADGCGLGILQKL